MRRDQGYRKYYPAGDNGSSRSGGERQRSRQSRPSSSKGSGVGILLGGLLLAAAILITCLVIANGNQKSSAMLEANTLYTGISIDGVDVSGLSREEAIQRLKAANANRLSGISVQIQYEGQIIATWGAEELGAYCDVEDQVDIAYQLGREGDDRQRKKEIRQLKREGYNAYTTVKYKDYVLEASITGLKNQLDNPMVEAAAHFDPNAEQPFTYTEGSTGYTFNSDKIKADIFSALQTGNVTMITVQTEISEPTKTVEELKAATKLISSCQTSLGSSSSNRIHNVTQSIGMFNGMVVQPGQRVSFNETTGERSEANGYLEAPEILGDKTLGMGFGGGVCQSSTTLYNAVLKAGLTVKARAHHSYPVSYVPKGLDAAVSYGYLDMVFVNERDSAVYIQTRVVDGMCCVYIYGTPIEDGMTIELTSTVTETIPQPSPTYLPDENGEFVTFSDQEEVKVPGRDGYKVHVTRKWVKDGVTVKEETLHDDYYQEIMGQYWVGITSPSPSPDVPSDVPEITPNPGPIENPGNEPGEDDEPVNPEDYGG